MKHFSSAYCSANFVLLHYNAMQMRGSMGQWPVLRK